MTEDEIKKDMMLTKYWIENEEVNRNLIIKLAHEKLSEVKNKLVEKDDRRLNEKKNDVSRILNRKWRSKQEADHKILYTKISSEE